MVAPLVFVDTETTSLDRRTRRPWEIGLIRREPDGTESRLEIVVTDVDLTDADPRSLSMNGFYDRHPVHRHNPIGPGVFRRLGEGYEQSAQELPEAVAARAVAWMTRGAHLVGACTWFDEDTLLRMLHRHRLAEGWHYHLIDVESLMLGYLARAHALTTGGPFDPFGEQASWKSHDLSKMLGVESNPATEHSAMADAEWAMRVYDAVMAGRESA